jgi:hypothetical protein
MTPQHSDIQRPRPLTSAGHRAVPRADARWDRPIFRPPPLLVSPAKPVLPHSVASHLTDPQARADFASRGAR